MAEAVFTISAEITPQLDDRELQRQAQQLAAQLNGILAKSIQPISVAPASGSFRPFQQEVDKAKGVLDRFQDGLGGIPRSISNIARAGRSNFLKFTDAINVTRREVVGFGRGIRDSIRVTNLFENALEGIRDTGSTISNLPQAFEDLSAQIRTGVSQIDQMAAGGNQLAQLFQPLQRQGEAARTEFVELNRSIDQLIGAVNQLNNTASRTGSTIRDQFGIPVFDQQIKSLEELLPLVASSPVLFNRLKNSIDVAEESGNLAGIHRELTEIITEAERVTGPIGRLKQELNEATGGKLFPLITEEARALNEELRKGAVDKLRELGGNELLGPFQNLASALRNIRENVTTVVTVFNTLRTSLANLLPGQSPIGILADSISDSVTFFRVLRAEGVPALQAIRGAAKEAFDQFKATTVLRNQGLFDFINRAKQEIAGLGLTIVQTKIGAKINDSLGSLGNFLNKNLVEPLRKSKGQIIQAASEVGRDLVSGLGLGIQQNTPQVEKEAKKTASKALQTLKKEFKIKSPSEETRGYGRDLMLGLAQGIQETLGQVTSALKTVAGVTTAIFAGLGAKALLAGKEFNVLKQVINASLPVIVGSKEAAAELLAEVNKLNDTSPFARSAFLELTRVLAGFGVEASKITPLIDAIQQSVAATGGSDQDLLELGQAFARIQSQGRVTGEVLQSFSVRGVDAVAILADGFGKLPGEMRKMISDGLVPANKAIDVLTKGLKEKFDGATEAVAKNFPGALQRVEARLRDIGGSLLTTFINPAGGGALVDFLNNMADSLSHINKELIPKLQPALIVVGDLLVKFSEKVEKVVKGLSGDEFKKFVDGLKPFLPVLVGLAALAPGAFGWIPVIGPQIAALANPFIALAAAIGVFLVQSGKVGPVMEGASSTIKELQDSAGSAATFLAGNFAGVLALITGKAGQVGTGIKTATGAFGGLIKMVPGLGPLGGVFTTIGNAISKFLGFLVPTVKEGGKLSAVGGGLAKAFPKLAGILKVLSGPFGLLIQIIVTLIATSEKFRAGLARLFNAVKPVAEVIGGILVVAVKILDEAIKSLEPVFVIVVNLLALFFEKLNLVLKPIKEFIAKMQEAKVIEKVFAGIKTGVQTAIEFVVAAINVLIKAYNALPFLDNVAEIKINFDDEVSDKIKKAGDDAKKLAAAQKKAAEDAAAAIEDNFNGATKAVELANKAMGDATEQLKTAIATAAGVIDGVISAARAVQTAQAAITTAREKESEAIADIAQLQKDYAKAIEDTITPATELAKAERDLRDVARSKTALDREELRIAKETADLRKELADLSGQEAAEDRAALVRAEERAQISLNRAKQSELDLINELNGANKISLNLAGLSLDQIRAKIAAARLSSSKERKKTAQELADDRRTARLDVEDAEAAVDAAGEARANFEVETNEKINEIKDKIRDNDERIVEIADDRADLLQDEQEQLKNIQRLREGETSQQRVILDFDQKIRDAKKIQEEAAKAIDTATKGAAIAQAEFRLKTAEAKGDAEGILAAQKSLWQLQGGDLFNSNVALRNIMGEQLKNVEAARNTAREMTAELIKANKLLGAAASLQGLGGSVERFEGLNRSIDNAIATGNDPQAIRLIGTQNKIRDEVVKGLRTALASGAAEQKNKNFEPWLPTGGQIEQVIRKFNELASVPGKSLRDAIRDALNAFGLSMPGFAAAKGLSPGMVHRGMNNGVGLVRMFEFGKEAVLPLTRPSDMARIVRDPRVLPAVMKALPGFARGFVPGDIITNALTSPRSQLREILQEIFKNLGMTFPGFYQGYAPGDLGTTGLGSLKPYSLSDFTSNSLSPILNTLPRWTKPKGADTSLDSGIVGELSSVVRAADRSNGNGPANAGVYEKKSQREFAETIGEMVGAAVKSALNEAELGDRNATINVNPNASETQRAIAREVKRQLDKRTGKW